MERHVLDLVTGMKENGFRVFVWCPAGAVADRYANVGAEVVRINIKSDIDLGYIAALIKYIRYTEIDVVHAHEPKAVLNALIASFLAGVKARVTHVHTPISEWKINGFKRVVTSFVYTFLVNLLSSVEIALTESRRVVKRRGGINDRKLVVIPNGIDLKEFDALEASRKRFGDEVKEKFGIAKNKFVFGMVGRMSVEKGHAISVKAFLEFLKNATVSRDDVHLLMAGGGPLEDEAKSFVRLNGMGGLVTVTGVFFSDDEKIRFYAAFDVMVLPSLAEGFGIVLLEAMAAGVPVLCSDLDVFREVGDGAVLFFEAGNYISLSEKMYSLYSKQNNLQTLSEAARERVKKLYSMEHFINEYTSLYMSLTEGRR